MFSHLQRVDALAILQVVHEIPAAEEGGRDEEELGGIYRRRASIQPRAALLKTESPREREAHAGGGVEEAAPEGLCARGGKGNGVIFAGKKHSLNSHCSSRVLADRRSSLPPSPYRAEQSVAPKVTSPKINYHKDVPACSPCQRAAGRGRTFYRLVDGLLAAWLPGSN